MCRVVVYALATSVAARPFDAQRQSYFMRGDVVMATIDGAYLGADIERGYPLGRSETWWRVIEIPGRLNNDARITALLSRDPGNSSQLYVTDLGYRTWKRERTVDLDALEAWAASELGRTLAQGEHITISRLQDIDPEFLDKITIKTPMPRSDVIG